VAISFEGFLNFLLIVIAPFLILSQLMILGNKEAIHRNDSERIVSLYAWAFVYPFSYFGLILGVYVTTRYPVIGTVLLVAFILGTLYFINVLKNHLCIFVRNWWYLLGLFVVLYVLFPLYIMIHNDEFSGGSLLYLLIVFMHFALSFRVMTRQGREKSSTLNSKPAYPEENDRNLIYGDDG